MTAASSSLNPSFIVDVVGEYPYPYPSHISTPNLVTVKLSGRYTYKAWKTQMSCLLVSHNMLGFINGEFVSPDDHGKQGDEWVRSDALVKSWILGSLSQKSTIDVIDRLTSKRLNQDFTAKEAWDELQAIYGIQQPPEEEKMTREADLTTEDRKSPVESKEKEKTNVEKLHDHIISGYTRSVDDLLKKEGLRVTDKIMNNGNTTLHVAVATNKNHELLEKMLAKISKFYPLAVLGNSDGSTLLHVAAMVDNYKAVDILMKRNQENRYMLITEDNKSHTPLVIALSNMHKWTSLSLLHHINDAFEDWDTLFSSKSIEEYLVLAVSSKDYDLANLLIRKLKKLDQNSKSNDVLTALVQNLPRELKFWERKIGSIYGSYE